MPDDDVQHRPPAGTQPAPVLRLRGAAADAGSDWLAEEVPVALVVNGISQAVMLATPTDLEDFAAGFAFTEGLVDEPEALRGVEVVPADGGLELRLEVSAASEWRLRQRRRSMAGRTGCGLCGTDSLAMVRQPLPALPPQPVAAAALLAAQRALRPLQGLQRLTGATHAAAWCAPDGQVRLSREDVGRHNALDKVIGAMRRGAWPVDRGFMLVTSRASFEMVQKTARAGIATLAAVSAPTAMAVDLARQCGLLLAGFVRDEGLVVYAGAERLVDPGLIGPVPSDPVSSAPVPCAPAECPAQRPAGRPAGLLD